MKRLLIYTPYSAWPNDTNIASYIAGIFDYKGWEVHLLTCGGVLRACDVRQPSRCPQFAQRDKQDMCAYCTDCRKYYNRLTTPVQHSLDDHLCDTDEIAARIAAADSAEALQSLELDGHRLYDIAESSLFVHHRKVALDLDDPDTRSLVRDYLFDAAVTLMATERFLACHEFDRVIVRNGRMNTTQALIRVLKRRGEHYFSLDRGLRKGTLNLVRDEIVHGMYQKAKASFDTGGDQPLTPAQLAEVGRLLLPEQQEQAKMRSIQFAWQSPQQLAAQLNLDRPYAVLLTSSMDEVQCFQKERGVHTVFANQREFIDLSCAHCHQTGDMNLVVRAHPNCGSRTSLGVNQSEVDYYAELKRRYADSPYVTVVESHEEINAYALCLGAAGVLTWSTSMTLELPCYGLLVAEAGGATDFELPFLHNIRQRQLAKVLALFRERGRLSLDETVLALRYHYAWKFLALFDAPDFDWQDWRFARLLAPSCEAIFAKHPHPAERIFSYVADDGQAIARQSMTTDTPWPDEYALARALRALVQADGAG